MKNFFKQLYWAIRYGDWDIDWDKEWLTKPHHEWFYCDHWALRIGKFYVGVSY